MAEPKTRQKSNTQKAQGGIPSGGQKYITAQTSAEFRDHADNEAFTQWLAENTDLTPNQRRRTVRFIERGIDIFGTNALNSAIDELDTFEYRIVLVDPNAYGYNDYITKTVKHAVRHLVAWARGTAGNEAKKIVNRPHATKKQAKTRGYQPLNLISAKHEKQRAAGEIGPPDQGDAISAATPVEPETKSTGKKTSTKASSQRGRKATQTNQKTNAQPTVRTAETATAKKPTSRASGKRGRPAAEPQEAAASPATTDRAANAEHASEQDLAMFRAMSNDGTNPPHLVTYIGRINDAPAEATFEDLEVAVSNHAEMMQRTGLLTAQTLMNIFDYMVPLIDPDAKYEIIKRMPGGTGRTVPNARRMDRDPSLQECMDLVIVDRMFPRLREMFLNEDRPAAE